MYRRNIIGLLLIPALIFPSLPNEAMADSDPAKAVMLCQKRSGTIRIREACRKREKQIDLTQLGLRAAQGPQGEPGPQGPKGDRGDPAPQGAAADLEERVAALEADNAEIKAHNAELEANNTEIEARDADLEAWRAGLETLLASVSLAHDGTTVRFTGVNVQIVSGTGETTATPNGLGNLIVGYNELRGDQEDCEEGAFSPSCEYPCCARGWDEEMDYCDVIDPNDWRWGSHNIVIGEGNNYGSIGGLVVGQRNTITDRFSAVTGGRCNFARNEYTSIAGGSENRADGESSTVSGGQRNRALGLGSSVVGGYRNVASGEDSVSGGVDNHAAGARSVAIGGGNNEAIGEGSSVTGGRNRTAPGEFDWVAGSLFEDD